MHEVLLKNSFDVDAAAEDLLLQRSPAAGEPRTDRSRPPDQRFGPGLFVRLRARAPQLEPHAKTRPKTVVVRPNAILLTILCVPAGAGEIEMTDLTSLKRSRTEAGRSSSEAPPEERPELLQTVFAAAAAGSMPTTTMDPVLAAMLISMRQMETLMTQLPGKVATEVAREVPAAVRDYDEAQAVETEKQAVVSNLGGVVAAIKNARNMRELGAIEGWRFNPIENSVSCLDCTAYASFSWLRNAAGLLPSL